MTIYEKIENMFGDDVKDVNQDMLQTILDELSEIKQILKFTPREYKKEYKKNLPKEYFDFVRKFREDMKEDHINHIYPEISFEGMRLGVNQRGLLYNKDTNSLLPRYKAFEVYEKLYRHYTINKRYT